MLFRNIILAYREIRTKYKKKIHSVERERSFLVLYLMVMIVTTALLKG